MPASWWCRTRSGGGAAAPVRAQIEQTLLRELPKLQRLPGHLERITALTAKGDLRVRVGLFTTPGDVRVVTALVNRIALAIVGGLVVVASALLLTIAADPGGSGPASLTEVFGFVGLAIGMVLVLRVVAGVVRDGYE